MAFSPNAQTVYADGPAGSPLQPAKSEIRKLLKQYENVIDAFLSNGGLLFSSKASLDASLNYAANSMAWVLGDATVANNGVYKKVGASGTGSWTRVSDLPFSFIIASDVGAGTANAIQATTSMPVSGSALIWTNVFRANTGSPVTISFNGGSALTIKTNTGNNVSAGGLVAGMIVLGIVSGSTFRLLNDQVSSAIVAAAEAAQVAAEAAQAAAEAAAAIGGGGNPVNSWRGYTELNTFTATGAAKSNVDGYLKLIASGASTQITLSGLTINGATERYLAIRYRRTVGTPGWDSDEDAFGWSTSGHGFTSSFLAKIINTSTGWKTAYLDMWSPFAGGTDWKTNTITGIRFFAANGVGADIDIAWIATCADAPRRGDVQNDLRFLQTQQDAGFTGSGIYSVKNIIEGHLDLLMTAPSLANGADVSAKVQALVNAAAVAKKTAFIPAHPLGFVWRFDSQIDLPANTKLVFDPASKSTTQAAVKTFRVTGSRVYLDGGFGAEFSHGGDGEFLDTNQKDAIQMRGFRLDVGGVTTKDGIIVSGSDTYIEDNAFGSFRTSSYAIRVAKKAGQININNKIVDNYFGGTGRAFCVSSEEAGERPEGITFSRNKSVLTGTTIVQVEAVLSLHLLDNMLDQGSFAIINLASSAAGIQGLTVDTCYIAAAQSPTGVGGGIGIRVDSGSVGVIDDVKITKNEIAWSAYGISLLNKVSNVSIEGNSLLNIDQIGISADADRLRLRDNTYTMTAAGIKKNLVLTEKAGGGSISIENENFDAAGTVDVPVSITRDRWNIGRTFGKVLRKTSSATAASPANQAYLPIPHGLIRAPSVITGLTATVANGAVYMNLRCSVVSTDATNTTVQIWHDGAVTPGNITFSLDASI
ncbi:hypothetical protein [Ensifer sp.]|uniref:hypothetical protein n=1 Tax=Ensifer sp. TaxID=1872086 RepID=UPI002E117F03|nr:hypothetical protein [Ensifer sp.]